MTTKEELNSKEISVSNGQYCWDTIELFKSSMGHLAERLWNIYSKELWNGSWLSWEEYLQDAGIGKGTASKLCSIYQRVVTELGFPAETLLTAPWTNLYLALPMMTDKENANRALVAAANLTSKEIMLERYEQKHGKACEHEHGVLMRKCTDCGTYTRVYEPTN